jgi:hypothetical protein
VLTDVSSARADLKLRTAFEAYLRTHHTTLTVGETITIPYGAHKYQFAIMELQPADAVRVVDTDLTVELDLLQYANNGYSSDRRYEDTTDDELEEVTYTPVEYTNIHENEVVSETIHDMAPKYYQFVWRKRKDILLEIHVDTGDCSKCNGRWR